MADENKDYMENYYQMLKDEQYKSLLDKEVQLNNSRERALKATNAGLGALGMSSSGYGQTATSGIEGQYLNAMENANQTYQNTMSGINQQEATYLDQKQQQELANQNASANRITEAVNSAYKWEDLNNLMTTFGLYDANGNFDLAKATELYGEENAKFLQTAFESQYRELGGKEAQETAAQTEANEQKRTTDGVDNYNEANSLFTDQNGKTGTVSDELNMLYNHMDIIAKETGYQASNGDVLKISSNNKSNASTIYIMYKDGKWVQVDQKAYNEASTKHTFNSLENNNGIWFFDGKNFNFGLSNNAFENWTNQQANNVANSALNTAEQVKPYVEQAKNTAQGWWNQLVDWWNANFNS